METHHIDYLILVNPFHKIPEAYFDNLALVEMRGYDNEVFRVEKAAAQQFRELQPVYDLLPKYGFILRYLKGKEKITGYPSEPWHIRFLGDPEVAAEIAARGITLEEYCEQR